eukprot:scaffold6361_cov132-Isochrysis_galbana.AAC.3
MPESRLAEQLPPPQRLTRRLSPPETAGDDNKLLGATFLATARDRRAAEGASVRGPSPPGNSWVFL